MKVITAAECRTCGEMKPVDQFNKGKYTRRDGATNPPADCRACFTAKQRAAWAADPDKYRAWQREKYARTNTETRRRSKTLATRGLTPDQYEGLLEQQGATCALCRTPWEPGEKSLSVDHDHRCCTKDRACAGCRRGLLCIKCNVLLGAADDCVVRLQEAIQYLVEWDQKHAHLPPRG